MTLSDLLGDWVRRHYPEEYSEGLTWSIHEYAQEEYWHSEHTRDNAKYEAIIYGENDIRHVAVPVCDHDDLFAGKFTIQAFLEDLFQGVRL